MRANAPQRSNRLTWWSGAAQRSALGVAAWLTDLSNQAALLPGGSQAARACPRCRATRRHRGPESLALMERCQRFPLAYSWARTAVLRSGSSCLGTLPESLVRFFWQPLGLGYLGSACPCAVGAREPPPLMERWRSFPFVWCGARTAWHPVRIPRASESSRMPLVRFLRKNSSGKNQSQLLPAHAEQPQPTPPAKRRAKT